MAHRDIFRMLEGITSRRGVGYARYSSAMQADGWTIAAQTRTITEHLGQKGIPLVEIKRDEAKSAKNTDRAGLNEALDVIRRGEANMLVVAKLDRATRELFDALGLDRDLKEMGASLYCIEESIDTADPQSQFLFQIHAIMAQRYRENLAFETAKGKRERIEDGLTNGDVHFGYRRATEADVADVQGDAETILKAIRRHPHIVVPEHATVIRLAFELYASGTMSDADVARALNERGYQIFSKAHPKGGAFTKDTVTHILNDPYYAGVVSYDGLKTHGRLDLKLRRRHGKTVYRDGAHEPIISQELYQEVHDMRIGRHHGGRMRSYDATIHVASRLVRCTHCGQPLRAGRSRGKTLYRDASRERGIPCGATRRSIPGDIIERALGEYIAAIHIPDDWQRVAMQVVFDDETVRLRAKKQHKLEERLAHLKTLVKQQIITIDEYRADAAEAQAQIAALDHEGDTVDLQHAAALLVDLARMWDGATANERREMILGIVEAIWVNLDEKEVEAIQLKDFLHPFCAGSRTGSVQGARLLPQAVSWSGPDGIPSSETYTITYTCARPVLPLSIPARRAEGPAQSPQWPDKHTVDARRDRPTQSDVARQITALRGAGQTWAEVAEAVGLSPSRVRALYSAYTQRAEREPRLARTR